MSIALMGGGMAIGSLIARDNDWNPSSNELMFTLVFVGGGAVTALAATTTGFVARRRVREEPSRGWRAACSSAWFWPGVILVFTLLSGSSLLFGKPRAIPRKNIDAPGIPLDLLPPVMVETYPISGETNVPPGTTQLRARFSKPMTDESWSWSSAWNGSTPRIVSGPHYADGSTCVITVELEAERTYAFWLNSEHFQNFKDLNGTPAVPYLLIFRTGAAVEPQTESEEGE